MKILYRIAVLVVGVVLLYACEKPVMINPNVDFETTYKRIDSVAFVGVPFYVISKGSGDFMTLYDGTPGHVWGKLGAKGVSFDELDSLPVVYNIPGKDTLTVVASSVGDNGATISREIRSIVISVVDARNAFTSFTLNGVTGVIKPNNEIIFNFPDVISDLNLKATFKLNSTIAKVFVSSVEQTSAVTTNDFSQPVTYIIRSANGKDQAYKVIVNKYASSNEKKITKLAFGNGGFSETAVIDEASSSISIIANYATTLNGVITILDFSYGSKVFISNVAYSTTKRYNFTSSGAKSLKVVAENNTEVTYTIDAVSANPLSSFKFAGLIPQPTGIIDDVAKTITIKVLKGTDLSKLVAVWTGTLGKVTASSTELKSGITEYDYRTPVTLTFFKGTVAGDKYIVNVIEI